jgi:hypothetical protein
MKKDKILLIYQALCAMQTDINEHLPALRKYASKCAHITEMGVRKAFTTWGFLAGLADRGGGTLHSIDWAHPSNSGGHGTGLDPVYDVCGGKEIEFVFFEEDSLKVEIHNTDLLFIDTNHVYTQLKEELKLHSSKVKKYIICHDTESCKMELEPAIDEFLESNKEWRVVERFANNNGLTILGKNSE